MEQARLMTLIDEAITLLEKRYDRLPTPLEVQTYLYAEYSVVEPLESVRRIGDDVLDLRNKVEE